MSCNYSMKIRYKRRNRVGAHNDPCLLARHRLYGEILKRWDAIGEEKFFVDDVFAYETVLGSLYLHRRPR